jgi:glycine/D-amino acid oxidase-like deaminating enzyme
MDRRGFLQKAPIAAASIAAAVGLPGCMRRPVAPLLAAAIVPVNLPEGSCLLPPVRVSRDRVIRTVVGLRPFRPSGFRVQREQIGDTAVVHNYGHGGGGITLSWGSAKLAVDLGAPGHVGPVAVLGSGVIGLTTARMLQDAGFDVTIYTRALPPDTTSNIAGGQWGPSSVYGDPDKVSQQFTDQYAFACKFAYERFQITTDPRYGVRWMRNYVLSNQPSAPHPSPLGPNGKPTVEGATDALMPEVKALKPGEHPFGDKYCLQFDGMLIEPPMFLTALMMDFRVAGGRIVVGEVKTPAQVLGLTQKLVFNCTGLGAKALFNDAELTPVRGQLTVLLPQPEVTYSTQYEDTYMFSRRDGVVLGGTHEEGNWSLDVDEATVTAKLAKQADLFNGMRPCAANRRS